MNQLSDKASGICDAYITNGCRTECPLTKACISQVDDDFLVVTERMNAAAESIEDES